MKDVQNASIMFQFNEAENGYTPNIKIMPKTYLVPKNCLKRYDVFFLCSDTGQMLFMCHLLSNVRHMANMSVDDIKK